MRCEVWGEKTPCFIFKPFTAYNQFLGGYAEGVTPVPISNTEVKPLRADDTARAAVWESRSPPGIITEKPRFSSEMRGFLLSSSGLWFLPRIMEKTG